MMRRGSTHSALHVAGELFKIMVGADMVHVPYRGGAPALTDLIGGQVQVMFDNATSSIEHIRAGRVRPGRLETRLCLLLGKESCQAPLGQNQGR